MSTPDRHLPWQDFRTLIDRGNPAIEAVKGTPRVEIFTDANGTRIGLRTPDQSTEAGPSQLVEIEIRKRTIGGVEYLEVSTTNDALYADFYAFACAVADRIQLQNLGARLAVDSALEAWSSLLERIALLTENRQTGLMGELWLIGRLGNSIGWPAALEAWKGWDDEEHDFSLEQVDIEVKTTLSEQRAHMIGSLNQLMPLDDRPLYVLSLQFTGTGGGPGRSLSDTVSQLREKITRNSPESLRQLNEKLKRQGWVDSYAAHYGKKFTLRSSPSLIPIDETFPAITNDSLSSLGPEKLSRLLQVSYRVEVSNLGYPSGSDEFVEILGEDTNNE